MAKRYGRKKYRKRRYKRKAKGKISARQLLRDAKRPGINSVAERAVAIIAKKEAEKLMPGNLILRSYWFGDYDNQLDTFANLTNLDRNGMVVSIAQVALMDQDVSIVPGLGPPTGQVIDPNMRPNPDHVYGQHVVAPRRDYDGYRRGADIKVKNIQFGMIVKLPFLQNAAPIPNRHYTTVFWRLVSVEEPQQLQALAGHKPRYSALHRLPTFGYSSRLDKALTMPTQGMKINVIAKGQFRMNYSYTGSQTKRFTIFRDLKGGIKIGFHAGVPRDITLADIPDLFGQRVSGRRKLYLAVAGDNEPGANAVYKPSIAAYTKVGYTDFA